MWASDWTLCQVEILWVLVTIDKNNCQPWEIWQQDVKSEMTKCWGRWQK
jgi:hypothetical protein